MMEKIIYLRDAERVIRDYFIECIEQDVDEVEVTEASSDLCSRMEGVAFVPQYGLPGDPVWFLLEDDFPEHRWLLSKETVMAIGRQGFYVRASTDPEPNPEDISFVPYTDVGADVFFGEEEALSALAKKEAEQNAVD